MSMDHTRTDATSLSQSVELSLTHQPRADESLEVILEEQFLQIVLAQELSLLLPITELAEIIKLPVSSIMPMFQMPAWVMGVYNWRGEMLWVTDLWHFLGFAPWYQQNTPSAELTVVIIKPSAGKHPPADGLLPTLGLLVGAVGDMVACPPDRIQPVPETAALKTTLRPYVDTTYCPEAGHPEWILDSGALLRAMARG